MTDAVKDAASRKKERDPRDGLKISAATATLFALVGHAWLGFEQSMSQLLVALATGYSCALLFEAIDARAAGRAPLYRGGGPKKLGSFLLSAHMTAVTTSFLLYANNRHAVMAFAVGLAIASKYIFRLPQGGRFRHFLNPSNTGIAVTLLLFPWVTVIPYEFTEALHGATSAGDWILPAAIVVLGLRLNALYTKRLALIAAWLSTFALQAAIRAWAFDISILSALAPMTGVAFVLFTLYMITDPMTSPRGVKAQVAFGVSLGVVYAGLMAAHAIYTLFFAVSIVCLGRGAFQAVLLARAKWFEAQHNEGLMQTATIAKRELVSK